MQQQQMKNQQQQLHVHSLNNINKNACKLDFNVDPYYELRKAFNYAFCCKLFVFQCSI